MPSLRRWGAVLTLQLVVTLAACSAFTGTDDPSPIAADSGSESAVVDASPTDAPPEATDSAPSFCRQFDDAGARCADFDDPGALYGDFTDLRAGDSPVFGFAPADALHDSRSLTVSAPPAGGADSEAAIVTRGFALPPGNVSFVVEADVLVEEGMATGDVAQIYGYAEGAGTAPVMLADTHFGGTLLSASVSKPDGTVLAQEQTVAQFGPMEWAHLMIEVVGNSTLEFAITTSLSGVRGPVARFTSAASSFDIVIGSFPDATSPEAFALRIDNVVVHR